jgi:serine/threonine protein kinase
MAKKKEYVNPWMFQGTVFNPKTLAGLFGFVYCITDKKTGDKYIGKKHFFSIRKKPGSTRRQKQESNWKYYFSSHNELKQLGKEFPERFEREILHLCISLGETNWREVEEQVQRNVLHSDQYINDNIAGRWFRKNVSRYYLKEEKSNA